MSILETGLIVFFSFWLLWAKLNIVTRLKLLGRPFLLDLVCSVGIWIMYGGTGEGLMAATFAALLISININVARKMFGYYHKKDGQWYYRVGKLNQAEKIRAQTAQLS
jgi:hypothetical protein